MSAASPATCGDAIEVPDSAANPLPSTDEVMATPGAATSGFVNRIGEPGLSRPLDGPTLDDPASTFALFSEPTVTTRLAAPGCRMFDMPWNGGLAVALFSLPAATTTQTPRRAALSAAWQRMQSASLQIQLWNGSLQPRLRFATRAPRRTACSSPWMTHIGWPPPPEVSTLMFHFTRSAW